MCVSKGKNCADWMHEEDMKYIKSQDEWISTENPEAEKCHSLDMIKTRINGDKSKIDKNKNCLDLEHEIWVASCQRNERRNLCSYKKYTKHGSVCIDVFDVKVLMQRFR